MYKDGAARRSVLRATHAAAAARRASPLGDEVLDGLNDDTRVRARDRQPRAPPYHPCPHFLRPFILVPPRPAPRPSTPTLPRAPTFHPAAQSLPPPSRCRRRSR